MRAGIDVDQLRADAHARAAVLFAAFEHIAHAELTPYLPYVDRPAFVGHCDAARDDEGAANARQICGQAIGDRIGKMALRCIAAEIYEWQHHVQEARASRESGRRDAIRGNRVRSVSEWTMICRPVGYR